MSTGKLHASLEHHASCGLQVLRALIEKHASEVGGREVSSLVSDLLPILIDKVGDNNTRIR